MLLQSCLVQGDHIISCNDLYGGTYRIFTKVFGRFGLDFSFVDMTDLSNIENAITPKTKLIWVETPTNPMLNIVDIAAVCALAKKHNLLVCVDNTFASPYLQTPLDLGADIVVHSATKYLGGHSDVIHGAVVVKDKALADQLYFIAKCVWRSAWSTRLFFNFTWYQNLAYSCAASL
jgi:cystathionine gamma-lyase